MDSIVLDPLSVVCFLCFLCFLGSEGDDVGGGDHASSSGANYTCRSVLDDENISSSE